MIWDYYASLTSTVKQETSPIDDLQAQLQEAQNQKQRREIRNRIEDCTQRISSQWKQDAENDPACILAAHIVDKASVWWLGEFPGKEEGRTKVYMPIAEGISISEPGKICDEIDFRPDFQQLTSSSWLGLQVDFELLTPWYSKDDRVFHVLDNPVRKDRVFGVPFMAASSWKGMLRWACRMQASLREHLEKHNGKLDGWRDLDWILHLFGHEKGEGEEFHRGALVFYPTWFDRIGFEVINPHSRERRAGTQPIYYEVVPGRIERERPNGEVEVVAEGGKGTLSLLYAPWPGMKPSAKPEEVLPKLLEAIETLLATYGISAKRTVGWGTAEIKKWRAYKKGKPPVEKDRREDLWNEIGSWFPNGGTS